MGIAAALAGCSTQAASHPGAATSPSPTTSSTVSAPTSAPAARTFPFSVMFSTSPCFNRVWTRLESDEWALRDAVTGQTYSGGKAYQGRCGFSVQFRLPESVFGQVNQVYVYDPIHQLVGLNQSNAGDSHVRVDGDVGPYTLAANAVITKGPFLTNCSVMGC